MTALNELENNERRLGSGLNRAEAHFGAPLAGMDTYGCLGNPLGSRLNIIL